VKTEHKQKKEIIERLVVIPSKQKRFFWAREMKFLNDFIKEYPDLSFWKVFSLKDKLESLLLLKGAWGKEMLKKKYLEYKYVIPENKSYNIGNKTGSDFKVKTTPRTIKDFLR